MRARLLTWLGIAVSIALLVTLLLRLDFSTFAGGFAKIRPIWLFGTLTSVAMAMVIRALRWQTLANAQRSGTLAAYWDSVNVMYFGNALYPGRIGEVMRIWSIYRWAQLPAGKAASTAIADRLADVFLIGLAACWVIASLGLGKVNASSVWLVVAFIGLPLVSLVALRWADRLETMVQSMASVLPAMLPQQVPRWYRQAMESAQPLRDGSTLSKVWLLSALAVVFDYLAFWTGLFAMGWQMPLEAAVLTGVLVAASTLIPSAPSSLGIYQLACVFGLRQYGVPEAEAVAYSFVVQGSSLLVVVCQTAITAARRGNGFLRAAQK